MNATSLGKILVFANLILSILFATWALGLYTNRLDWPGGGAPVIPGGKALGEVGTRKAEIADREKATSLALNNWILGNATLNAMEFTQRPTAQKWYADKLKLLEDGQAPVGALVYGKDGKLQLQDGAAIPGPDGQPLRARAPVQQLIAATEAETQQLNTQALNDLKEAEELTAQINGVREGNEIKLKGLRDLLAEEELANTRGKSEIEYTRPFRYNRQIEAALIQERQAALAARMDELKKVSAAFRLP
jgi:hypothetical protein